MSLVASRFSAAVPLRRSTSRSSLERDRSPSIRPDIAPAFIARLLKHSVQIGNPAVSDTVCNIQACVHGCHVQHVVGAADSVCIHESAMESEYLSPANITSATETQM